MDIEGPQGLFIYRCLFYLTFAMNALITYLRHVREEFKHIVWPTRETAVAHTLVVIVIAVAIMLLVAILDYIFGNLVSRVVGA